MKEMRACLLLCVSLGGNVASRKVNSDIEKVD